MASSVASLALRHSVTDAWVDAAVNDAYAALVWVKANGKSLNTDPLKIAVAGDSAGGNLAAAVCLMSRDRKGPSIAFQALIYPGLDAANLEAVEIGLLAPLLGAGQVERGRPAEAELHRLITITVLSAHLGDIAGPGPDDGDGTNPSVVIKDLGHPKLGPQYPFGCHNACLFADLEFDFDIDTRGQI